MSLTGITAVLLLTTLLSTATVFVYFLQGKSTGVGFQCTDRSRIPQRNVCDGTMDCADGSDEISSLCRFLTCPTTAFRCRYGACISKELKCDGKLDCMDHSDESHCGNCSATEFLCGSGECVNSLSLCDGKADCVDKSDEAKVTCTDYRCPEQLYQCQYAACVSISNTCEGEPYCAEHPELCGSCFLPHPAPHTLYNATNCTNCLPGTSVFQNQKLDYTCEVGHRLVGSSTVRCHNSTWLPSLPVCVPDGENTSCPAIQADHMSVTCGHVPCDGPLLAGTTVQYQCHRYYVPNGEPHHSNECQRNGTWKNPIPECVPECGVLQGEAVPLVVHGRSLRYGTWPWQAGLFQLQDGNWTFWCGGSLVSNTAVVTAGHCVWNTKEDELRVVLGKFYRDFERNENLTQLKAVRKIEVQPAYQDKIGNYGSDLAVLILSTPVQFSSVVRPVCIDWDLQYAHVDLTEGRFGTVAGWGVNENETFSDSLRVVQLPVVSDQKCIEEQSEDFKKYVTFTSFCAGRANGTGVCNGDSGGGLIFPHNGTWVLQGVVSVSPRKRGTSFCDPYKYTVFTKVAIYTQWLKSVLDSAIIKG